MKQIIKSIHDSVTQRGAHLLKFYAIFPFFYDYFYDANQ